MHRCPSCGNTSEHPLRLCRCGWQAKRPKLPLGDRFYNLNRDLFKGCKCSHDFILVLNARIPDDKMIKRISKDIAAKNKRGVTADEVAIRIQRAIDED